MFRFQMLAIFRELAIFSTYTAYFTYTFKNIKEKFLRLKQFFRLMQMKPTNAHA